MKGHIAPQNSVVGRSSEVLSCKSFLYALWPIEECWSWVRELSSRADRLLAFHWLPTRAVHPNHDQPKDMIPGARSRIQDVGPVAATCMKVSSMVSIQVCTGNNSSNLAQPLRETLVARHRHAYNFCTLLACCQTSVTPCQLSKFALIASFSHQPCTNHQRHSSKTALISITTGDVLWAGQNLNNHDPSQLQLSVNDRFQYNRYVHFSQLLPKVRADAS